MITATLNIGWEYGGAINMPNGTVQDVALTCEVVPGIVQNFLVEQKYVTWTGPGGFEDASAGNPDAFPVVQISDPCTGDFCYALENLIDVQRAFYMPCCDPGDGIYKDKNPSEPAR